MHNFQSVGKEHMNLNGYFWHDKYKHEHCAALFGKQTRCLCYFMLLNMWNKNEALFRFWK